MGSTPVLKSSEVADILRKLGFDVVRQRGSHLAKDIGMTLEEFLRHR